MSKFIAKTCVLGSMTKTIRDEKIGLQLFRVEWPIKFKVSRTCLSIDSCKEAFSIPPPLLSHSKLSFTFIAPQTSVFHSSRLEEHLSTGKSLIFSISQQLFPSWPKFELFELFGLGRTIGHNSRQLIAGPS